MPQTSSTNATESHTLFRDYKRGRKVPPTAFMVAFVKALNLDARSTRTLLRTYMRVRPELEEFVRLWFGES
jgi:hypothetical protein